MSCGAAHGGVQERVPFRHFNRRRQILEKNLERSSRITVGRCLFMSRRRFLLPDIGRLGSGNGRGEENG